VSDILPIVLFALAGLLIGGAYSLGKQGANRGLLIVLAVLATLALIGGLLWLLP